MNETIRKQKTEKHEVGRTSGPTGKSRFAGRNVLLSAGLGLALTATCGGSSSSPNTTDAGACTMVKGTDGLNTCTPADVCALGLVPDNPTSDGGTSKAGCVPKQKRDASPVEASQGEVSEDAEAAEVPPIVDTAPVSPVDVAEPDAKVAVDTSVDAGPVCTVKKATRAYVKLGSNWRIAGYACDTNGSESKMDDGVTVERKTETGDFETCAVAVTPGTATSVTATPKGVTVTCPTVTIQAGTGGCTQTAVEETSACANTCMAAS